MELESDSPQIVLSLAGRVEVSSAADSTCLEQGQALFVEDVDGPVILTGSGRVAVGRPPA